MVFSFRVGRHRGRDKSHKEQKALAYTVYQGFFGELLKGQTLSSHTSRTGGLPDGVVNPGLPLGSRENYLYFTLPVCINFQRSSPAMWASALKTYEDEATRYVFFPEELATRPIDQIRADLTKHKLALQPNEPIAYLISS